jgi:hypothetical protein
MKFKGFKIVKICLTLKNKFLGRELSIKILFQHFHQKRKDPEPAPEPDAEPNPDLCLTDPDAEVGGPRTYPESGTLPTKRFWGFVFYELCSLWGARGHRTFRG